MIRTMLAGRYRVTGALGEGGEGAVLAGEDAWFGDRPVALKRVPPQSYERLAAEFATLRRVRHPALVRALDLFRQDGAAYLVEARVDGEPINLWAAGRPARAVFAAAAPIAHALAHLHARRLVHMDPSPNNVLVGGTAAVLIDLGLTRLAGVAGPAGTPGFIAPEVQGGAPAGPAADVYSLGATLAVALGAPVPQGGAVDLGPVATGDARALLDGCLRADPSGRPDALTLARQLCRIGGVDVGRLRPVADVPLCGREAELESFGRWLEGNDAAFHAGGGAGSGKSAFLSSCADRARLGGWRVIELAGDDPGALASLLRRLGGPAAAVAANAEERAHLAALALDAAHAAKPTLLVVDDADSASPELRAVLAILERRRGGGARLLTAGAPSERRGVTLSPLSDAAVLELLELAHAEKRSPAEAARLAELCGRSPRALARALARLAEHGGTVFDLRAEDLSLPMAVPPRLLPLSLASGALPASVVLAVTGQLHEALAAGFLEASGEPGLYRVPLFLRAAAASLEGESRRRAELALAAALDAAALPLAAAVHWARGGEVARAFGRLGGDAGDPLERLAAIGAVADVAGDEALPVELLEEWGRLAARSGDDKGARRVADAFEARGEAARGRLQLAAAQVRRGRYQEALLCIEGVPESVERAVVAARAELFLGRTESARRTAESGLAAANGESRAELLDAAGHARFACGDPAGARQLLETAVAEAASAGDARRLGRAQNSLAIVLQRLGERTRALELYRASLTSAEGLARVTRTQNLATLLQDLGELDAARAHYRAAYGQAVALASLRDQALIGVNLANLEVLLGELAVGARLAEEVAELCAENALGHAAAMAALVAAEAALERQVAGDAARALGEADRHLAGVQDPVAQSERALLGARLVALEGDPSRAAALALAIEEAAPAAHLARHAAFFAARFLASSSEPPSEAALAAAGRAGAAAERSGDGELLWRALAVECRLRDLGGDKEADGTRGRARAALESWRARLPADVRDAYLSLASRRQAARWVEGARPSVAQSRLAPSAAQLRRLVAINRRLAREQDPDALLELIIDTAIELLGAERGFLLLRGSAGVRVAVARNFDRRSLEDGSQRISRSIASEVLERGEAVLTTNAQADARFAGAKSVVDSKVRSVLCTPLRGASRQEDPLIGAIYLDHRFQERAFTDEDVELCEAFADQAAIAVENAQLLSQTREQERRLAAQNDRLERLNAQLLKDAAAYAAEAEAALVRLREEGPKVGVGKGFERFVGKSDLLRGVLRLVERFADTDVPVLIFGESGTGKELVARAIHERSGRRGHAFVGVNCGAVPEALIESELFGYKRGAFTGAVKDKQGLIAAAEGGTLFLDEVGEMPLAMQVKLLRVLQEREYRPVGATASVDCDVRIVSASHAKLEERVAAGSFRQDLFYRLHVVEIAVPPLRERREDIPLLVDHFCQEVAGRPAKELIAADALGCFLAYDWPGNVRELDNEVRRALALADGPVQLRDLSERLQSVRAAGASTLADVSRGCLKEILDAFEREVLLATLERTGWNVKQAAKELGLSRAALYTRLSRFGITRGA